MSPASHAFARFLLLVPVCRSLTGWQKARNHRPSLALEHSLGPELRPPRLRQREKEPATPHTQRGTEA